MTSLQKRWVQAGLLAAFLAFSMPTAYADREADLKAIEMWYKALQEADAVMLEDLMASEGVSAFVYKVNDLGIMQNRAEFIASMDEWVGAIAGGSVTYEITNSYEGGHLADVCYRFTDSSFLASEQITMIGSKIAAISQNAKADSCEGF